MKEFKQDQKCPRCGKEYNGFPALSRRDNQTDICGDCGEEEAFIDAEQQIPSMAMYIPDGAYIRDETFKARLGVN